MSELIEIERKFLVLSDAFKSEAFNKSHIVQGFLNSDKDRIVRVRLRDNEGFLTVKGKPCEEGLARFEWEKQITKSDAEALLQLCEEGMIDKIRYEIKAGYHVFEVDEFFGANDGLIVAEIELNNVSEVFEKPDWLGKEVTGQSQYYNSQLLRHPFKAWAK